MIEGDANTAPAEERVVFLDREVGQRLVTTDVQTAHGHRQRMESGQLLAVDRQLFLFTWEALVDHERHFGSVQPHPFGTTLLRTRHVGQQTGVDPQWHAMPVEGDARQFAQGIQALGELTLLLHHLAKLLAHDFAGVGEDFAVIAVDHQIDAIDLGIREIHQAHDRGNTHGPRQNRNVGVAGTLNRHQTDQFAFRHLAEHGRGQLFTHQNRVVGIDQRLLPRLLEIGQQTAAQVLDVRRPLAQVGIVHQFETFDVLTDHRAQGALRPLAGLDDVGHFAAQRSVVEHHQVDIEQRPLFGTQLGGELGRQGAHVTAHTFQSVLEQRQLGSDVSDGLVGDHFQIGRRQHDHGNTDRSTRRTGHTHEFGFLNAFALTTQTADRAGCFGMRDNARQLRAHGDQEGFFALVELTTLLLLDDQHTDHTPVMDDRRAQERGVALFTGFGEIAITRVICSVFEIQRFFARTDQTDQAFIRCHADFADGALVEALGSHQDKAVDLGIEQVDRADLAAHGLLDAQHNNAQRRLEILGGVNFLDDLAQRIEHGSGSNSVSVAR